MTQSAVAVRPIPEHSFQEADASRACVVVDLLSTTSAAPNSTTPHPVTDLEILESSLKSVAEMLDRVLSYVQQVLAGEVKGDAAVGRYLMDTLGASTEDLEKSGFNSSLQVRRMMQEMWTDKLTLRAGYIDGVVSRKPCALASRGVSTPRPCNISVAAQLYDISCSDIQTTGWMRTRPSSTVAGSTVEYPRVL